MSPIKQRIHDMLMEARRTKEQLVHDQVLGRIHDRVRQLVIARAQTMQTAVVTQLAASIPAAVLSEYDRVFTAVWLVSLRAARATAVI